MPSFWWLILVVCLGHSCLEYDTWLVVKSNNELSDCKAIQCSLSWFLRIWWVWGFKFPEHLLYVKVFMKYKRSCFLKIMCIVLQLKYSGMFSTNMDHLCNKIFMKYGQSLNHFIHLLVQRIPYIIVKQFLYKLLGKEGY